jgi:molecular chaperone GrpE
MGGDMVDKLHNDQENDVDERIDQPGDGGGTEPAEITEAELEQLKDEARKAQEHWNQLLRTAADFDNYKKRAARERADASKYAIESLLQKLIPVLDSFEMAMAATQTADGGSVDALQQGVSMVYQQLRKALSDAGLQEINAANEKFDPTVHEALSQIESKEVPEGHVVQQVRKGYKLHDRLIRPASVIVAKAPRAS